MLQLKLNMFKFTSLPMFFTTRKENYSERVTIIGEFVKVDGIYVVLRTGNEMVKVRHNGLEKYRTKYILVMGTYEEDVILEERVFAVEDDFNKESFEQLAKLSHKFASIF